MRYTIRELKLGEILDQAVNLTKDHFGVLLGITGVLMIPFYVLGGLIQVSMIPKLPPNPTPEQAAAVTFGAMRVSLPFGLLGAYVITPITNAAVVYAISNAYLEKPISVGGSFKRAFQRILALDRHLAPRRPGHYGRHAPLLRSWNPRRILVCSGNTGGRHRERGGIRGPEAEQAVNGRQYRDLFRVGAPGRTH